ncbi:glycosyltransferase family 4 protein [Tenacibaculum sp. 190524A05c]|uniref:glycosyltransferase family 4 protein n=1 Tax=Tenacibaculum platacis TaxID=3137852 RepID=UPI0031FB34E9
MNQKTKKHILFLCGWYPSRVLPNNGDFIQRHAEAVGSKHKVSAVHIISDPNIKSTIEISTEVINGVSTYIAYVKPSVNTISKIFRFYKAFQKLLKLIGEFDFVHLNKLFPFGIFALYLNRKFKKEFIISEHWTGYHQPQVEQLSKVEQLISKRIAKKAKYICPVSKDLQNSMELFGLKGNYHPVPNVVDTNSFSVKTKDSTNSFSILHASNMLDEHKNVSGIIRVISKFKEFTSDFKLILIGESSIKYKVLSDKLKISNHIEFIEHVPHKEIIQHMQNANVFVLFSNYENLPCVILESFSCGTPVISTNVGGISEFFPNNFGHLIAPNNELELLKALKSEYHEKVNKEELHKYATQHFSKEVICNTFSELYLN